MALPISLACIHGLFSLVLMNPAYLGKFFGADGRMNVLGEIGIAVGVIALWTLSMPAIATLPMMAKEIGGARWKRGQRMGYLCLFLVLVHMLAFGWRGWLTPGKWPWGLPPISLLAAIAAAVPLVHKLRRVRGSRRPSDRR